ncbi:[protein-PII] uridylyltransferase [Granulicella arctica]|uniref:[protein-PII] uridylyltransferase n=1 Tax=Granulicella arctica TaxID=940613 RepID=UPI0021E0586E|nr:[protein-PII] uridylyltransferase [Granulicella arctica]
MQANEEPQIGMRGQYQRRMLEIRGAFEAGASGSETIAARSLAIDGLVQILWQQAIEANGRLASGIAVLAVGGYGRKELFPYSDVDLLFLLDGKVLEKDVKDSIRRVSQELWDCGIRVSPTTRKAAECDKFDPDVAEFTLSLLDHRLIAGDALLHNQVLYQALPKLLRRENKAILARLVEVTRARHAKYGDTLFHLEPNIKDCPGGLRDVHVCGWIVMLRAAEKNASAMVPATGSAIEEEFRQAIEFLYRVRCFLHYRHERDDNTLDWQAQDSAAASAIGFHRAGAETDGGADAAYWMRLYFRHARSVERRVEQMLNSVTASNGRASGLQAFKFRRSAEPSGHGYRLEKGRVVLEAASEGTNPAHDPYVVLHAFAALSNAGGVLGQESEERLSQALPLLSAQLEEGAALWHPLRGILTGHYAGGTLRAMHALGILELLVPEFHGIDALVIRDAYHRYTVDEHTFVVIDTLHHLEDPQKGPLSEWTAKFSAILRDIPHPELLYLGALLHDTGKGRSSGEHSKESARLARSVLDRLDLDTYESGLVISLIENHLEMSAALRRDIFDAETVRAFAGKVMTPEALRMLTLFTYADINAVHPDALTPWKAENIWRLYMAASNYLDRNVDDERVSAHTESELVHRVAALLPVRRAEIAAYLEGFPERYLRTRTPEQVRNHFEMTTRFAQDAFQLELRHSPGMSELTLVTQDRPQLFATMAGALAAWGMNIVTADAFSNRQGIVVDSFVFTDTFRTLEMNASEHTVFVKSVHDVVTGAMSLDRLLSGRRRTKRRMPKLVVQQKVDFDEQASSHSTLLQVIAQDVPGLLRALSLTLAAHGCNIEVALVDTEGETAIDVFYLTQSGSKLERADQQNLQLALMEAIRENAQ